MARHLSQIELENYRRRKLSPEDLLAADDHLAGCADCRAQLEADPAISEHVRFLQSALRPVHLSDAELDALVDGRLRDPNALAHMEGCPQCRGEAEDLRAFVLQQGMAATPPKRLPVRALASIAALVIAVVGAAVILKKPAPAPVVQVTQSELPKDLQDLRNEALASGRVEIPQLVAQMINRPEGLLRGGATQPGLQLETPVATATLTLQPEFRWRGVPSADWYQVAVFDSQFNPIVESEHLTTETWRCTKPLDPAKEYLWQVTISTGGRKSVSPAPPEPEARFVVLSETESSRLAALASQYPDDRLLLGVLYARAGALEHARQLWKDPQTGKPVPGADRLVQSIERVRRQ